MRNQEYHLVVFVTMTGSEALRTIPLRGTPNSPLLTCIPVPRRLDCEFRVDKARVFLYIDKQESIRIRQICAGCCPYCGGETREQAHGSDAWRQLRLRIQ